MKTKKPTISYLLPKFGFTGGSMVLYNFMDRLAHRGYEVSAVTPTKHIKWSPHHSEIIIDEIARAPKPRTTLDHVIKDQIKKRLCTKNNEKLKLLWLDKFNKGLINNWIESDVTISTFCYTAIAGFYLSEKTIPLYHMQHHEEIFFDNDFEKKIAQSTYYLPLHKISNSTWLQDRIKRIFKTESFLLNPGINYELFKPHRDIVTKYTDSRKKSIILSYCSMRPFKAWKEAVEAMKIVFDRLGRDKIEWIVFGEQPQGTDLPITYTGKVFNESLAKLYSEADVVFMNSWYESFPLPPLEAMACGSAVVCTQFGVEDYAFNGKNALVVEPKNSEALSAAIISLVNNSELSMRLALAGRKTAEMFNWEKKTDDLENILHEIL